MTSCILLTRRVQIGILRTEGTHLFIKLHDIYCIHFGLGKTKRNKKLTGLKTFWPNRSVADHTGQRCHIHQADCDKLERGQRELKAEHWSERSLIHIIRTLLFPFNRHSNTGAPRDLKD